MFPTNETPQKPDVVQTTSLTPKASSQFDSIDEFATWLDTALDTLVAQYSEFETDSSIRNFFKR